MRRPDFCCQPPRLAYLRRIMVLILGTLVRAARAGDMFHPGLDRGGADKPKDGADEKRRLAGFPVAWRSWLCALVHFGVGFLRAATSGKGNRTDDARFGRQIIPTVRNI